MALFTFEINHNPKKIAAKMHKNCKKLHQKISLFKMRLLITLEIFSVPTIRLDIRIQH